MLTPWSQVYSPLGSLGPSALVAALPVVVLLALLGIWHVRAHVAALAGLATAALIAVAVFGMPTPLALAAIGDGAIYGLFPIGWIVLNAIFVYSISVETGTFAIVRESVVSIAEDRRLQALLVAFSFGAFVEGAAGFGTPVAISAAMLIGLGFKPLPAAGLSLIGNTAPVAFGVGHADHRACWRDAFTAQRSECDGGQAIAAVRADHSVLVDLGNGWVARHERGVARVSGCGRHVWRNAVLHQQSFRPDARRHRCRCHFDCIVAVVTARVEAKNDLAVSA